MITDEGLPPRKRRENGLILKEFEGDESNTAPPFPAEGRMSGCGIYFRGR